MHNYAIAAIEGGGTKFYCGYFSADGTLISELKIPTSQPDSTLNQVFEYFKHQELSFGLPLKAVGLASFGPVDLNKSSPTYGSITTTPKKGWQHFPILRRFEEHFELPVRFETDVNASAIGEYYFGAGKEKNVLVYITVGTGIGGGILIDGQPIHGLVHPEIGHILVARINNDQQPSVCPYHRDCVEGLASGPALNRRTGSEPVGLLGHEPALLIEADYLSQMLHNVICTVSPDKIIIGGGVMQTPGLLDVIQKRTIESLSDYVQSDLILDRTSEYIVRPALGSRSALYGAYQLAISLLNNS